MLNDNRVSLLHVTWSSGMDDEMEVKKLERALCNNTSVKSVTLTNNTFAHAGFKALCKVLKNNTRVETLSFYCCAIGMEYDDNAHVICALLNQNNVLKKLDLGYTKVSAQSLRMICEEGLKSNTSLRELMLSGNRFGQDGTETLGVFLKRNKSIVRLGLASVYLGPVGIRPLSDALLVNVTLTSLDLGFNNLGHDGIESLCEALKQNKSLLWLDLSGNQLEIHTAGKLIGEMLSVNSTLRHLMLASNHMSAEGLRLMAHGLRQNASLKHLDLYNNQFQDEGGMIVAEVLRHNQSLTEINLTGNKISGKPAQDMAESLKSNKSLTILCLNHNCIGTLGAVALADALMVNRTITELAVNSNQIGVEGARALSGMLQVNHNIKRLHLSDNMLGKEGALALVDAFRVNQAFEFLDLYDWTIPPMQDRDLARILQLNGNLLEYTGTRAEVKSICVRNREMHDKIREIVCVVLCIRAPNVPKEVFKMLAQALWKTKSDVEAWNYFMIFSVDTISALQKKHLFELSK